MNRVERYVSVAGSGECTEEEARLAYEVGRLVAERGGAVVCGGLGGVMESVCRGAAEAGGVTVGLLPGAGTEEANRYVQIAIPTGLGESRNVLVARACDALVAIGTGYGTLSEIALALKNGTPVVGLASWDLAAAAPRAPGYLVAATPEEAVALALP